MNWRQFVASLLQASAWPVTVLTVALLFRKKINDLLGRRLTRFKAGPVEAEWTEAIREANEAIAPERPAEPEPEPAEPTEPEPEPAEPTEPEPEPAEPTEPEREAVEPKPEPAEPKRKAAEPKPSKREFPITSPKLGERFRNLLEEVRRLIAIEPGAAVALGFSVVEQALLGLAHSIDGFIIPKNTPTGSLVTILAEQGIIAPRTAFAIDKLGSLRSATVHGHWPHITRKEAAEYVNALEVVVETLTHPAAVYESNVAAAINRVARVARTHDANGSDLLGMTSNGRVAVVVKYRTHGPLAPSYIERNVMSVLKAYGGGALVVTNVPLADSTLALNKEYAYAKHPIEVVTWNSKRDDKLLDRAIFRTAR